METVFTTILQMSSTASWVILAVLLARLALRKAPKKYSYWLWSVVGFRLCCPVSWQVTLPAWALRLFSAVQRTSPAAAPAAPVAEAAPVLPSTATADMVAQNPVLAPVAEALPAPNPAASADPIQIWLFIGAVIWCVGITLLMGYSVFSYLRLRRRMETAILLRDNIYQSDHVRSPFILGFIRPKIYIPFDLDEETSRYVLAHEGYHLRRRDHLIRALAFLVLSVHWFNPLCWLSFYLMGKDMEMSCDENVLSKENGSVKNYSMSLLSFAANRRFPAPSPLAYGETAVKSRIKNALHWRRPKTWVTLVSALLCLLVIVSCSADPAQKEETVTPQDDAASVAEQEQSPADLPEEPSEGQQAPEQAPDEPETSSEQTAAVQPDITAADVARLGYVDWLGGGSDVTVDLDGDLIPETVSYTTDPFSLSVNGKQFLHDAGYGEVPEYDFWLVNPEAATCFIVDLDASDSYLEIGILYGGDNDWWQLRLFRYDAGVLTDLDSVYGVDFRSQLPVFHGEGSVTAYTQIDIMQSWHAYITFVLEDGQIRRIEDEEIVPILNEGQTITLLRPLTVYAVPDIGSDTVTLEPSDQPLSFPTVYGDHWLKIETADGTSGWVYFDLASVLLEDGSMVDSTEVFDGLAFYG
ncbi:MAG: hypothetical protein IJ049_00950 [Oscillospiraceae bacterium]|nr:hypothetical protein [Oscillospiraceae bacterium]